MTARSASGIWSEEAGDADAPLIALVHGSMDRSAGLLKLSRRLDDRFRVLRYDRRGYGRSAPHGGPFTMDGQVADLVEVLAGRPAVVFGHSYGGNVALALADRHPDLVRAVGVYETPLPWVDWWPDSTAGTQATDDGTAPDDAAERFMRRMIGDARWERLPSRTRLARRAEGAAMLAELVDIDEHVPWDPARDHSARRVDARERWPAPPPPVQRPAPRLARRLPGRDDRGSPALRAQHAARRGGSRARGARQSSGDATVTSRPKNVHVVSSAAPSDKV